MKNLKNVSIALFTGLIFSTVIVSCSKDKTDKPSAGSDEAAASRIVGSYKGTITPLDVELPTYYNATIIITKESGNKVKVAPKSGEAYSGLTSKIIAVQAILASEDVTSGANEPQGIIIYTNTGKNIRVTTKETAATDVAYDFEGTKQ